MTAVEELQRQVPPDWQAALHSVLCSDQFSQLAEFVRAEREVVEVYPPADQVFAALKHSALESVRVVILGQDPYHGSGQAHGLAFSVQRGVKPPPSLKNIYRELHEDLRLPIASHGDLTSWAEQGVLLLNTVLTVRAATANSHRKRGWEAVTDAIFKAIADRESHVVFVLWGAPARKKKQLINTDRHTVIESAHPSPLSARNGFFGSRPFSKVNVALAAHGQPEIDWELPE